MSEEQRNTPRERLTPAEIFAAAQVNKFVGDRWSSINLDDVYNLYARSLRIYEARQ